jgi:hypothetical protein
VKLDIGILDSTLWLNRDQREVFITGPLMALQRELLKPIQQIRLRDLY